MRIAVTGATGNVGCAVLRRLARDERVEEIVGIARRIGAAPPPPRTTWRAADVRDSMAMRRAFDGVDAVVHLAWAIQPSRDRSLTRSINLDGSETVFASARRAGVGLLVHASSVGVYGRADGDAPVGESHPAIGLPTSFYSVDKVAAEHALDRHSGGPMRTVALRPSLIFQREAAEEIRRLFAGPFVPTALLRPGLVPVVPRVTGVRFQAVHADDVAAAYHAALTTPRAHGAYNVATDDVLDLTSVARLLRAATVPAPFGVARAAAAAAWHARLTPTPPGWLDLAAQAPVLSARRAREELGWAPRRTGHEALAELLQGLRDRAGGDTPPLAADAGGPYRLREIASGLGARLGGRRKAA